MGANGISGRASCTRAASRRSERIDAETAVGPWAKEKLGALRHCLTYFNRVLKNQTWCTERIYVDAFAGPGRSPIRTKANKPLPMLDLLAESDETASAGSDLTEYVNGSPRVALEIPDPFTRYIFVETADDRIAKLQAMRDEHGATRAIEIVKREANEALLDLIERQTFHAKSRSFIFLDPFAMQLPWSTIEALARTKTVEVIINFPLGMAIQRLLTRSAEWMPGWEETLDVYFGSTAWREQAYEVSIDLFGKKTKKRPDAAKRLTDWYRRRLEEAFGFVSTARLVRNTRGAHLYYLIWAGPHKAGLRGADYILRMGEVA
ncbi:MAG: three-Cys-motif partner protein TcmP [Terricaulis sp.]